MVGTEPGIESRSEQDPGEPTGSPGVAAWGLVVVALGFTTIGVGLRFVAPSPLWLDEALSVNIASLPVGEIPDALRQDGHPPAYYLILHHWMEVFFTLYFICYGWSFRCCYQSPRAAFYRFRLYGAYLLSRVFSMVIHALHDHFGYYYLHPANGIC